MGMPWAVIGGMIAYRKSWFDEVGATKFPDTWESYREVAKKLKAKGRPFGQTLGHTFGDAPGFTYPYLWSWGGKEVEADGKTVVINSKATVDSVKFMQGLWKDGMDEGGLAWDDTNNNRAFLSQTISATLNGASIYIESLRKPDQYKTEKGDAAEQGHPARAAAQGPGRAVRLPSAAVQHADEVFEEPGRGEGVPEVAPHRGQLPEVLRIAEGLRHAVHGQVGRATSCGTSIRS